MALRHFVNCDRFCRNETELEIANKKIMILRNLPTVPSHTTGPTPSPKPSTKNPTPQSLLLSFSLFKPKSPNPTLPLYRPIHSLHHPHTSSSQNAPGKTHFLLETLILSIFSLSLLCLRLASGVLLPNFPLRWQQLVASSEEAEAEFSNYPSDLWRAVLAYEDRRFFQHFGIDPVGIGRAVLSFSARGGGSTITQQLVKNTFLKNERTFSRKLVEMVLALALEWRISKLRILSSYLNKIYFGHGINGVEMASNFYFGKHPTFLNLGECAMLAGMIPAPEFRSPLKDSSRGKTFQARVLKRMVEVGCLDIETALLVAKQSLHLRIDDGDHGSGPLLPSSSSVKGKAVDNHSPLNRIWDWERESKIWEVLEDMERWVVSIRKRTQPQVSGLNR